MSNVEPRVIKIVAEKLNVKEEEITPDASFSDDLGADSLDLIEIVMSLENEFDITIDDEDTEKIVTVKGAIDYINENLPSE